MHQFTGKRTKKQQQQIINHVNKTDCYGFYNLLTSPTLHDVVNAELPKYRERIYTPTVTLSLFMNQVLSSDSSCQNTVNTYAIGRVFNNLEPCSTGTGVYCKARQNLPLKMVRSVAQQTGQMLIEHTPEIWQWRGSTCRVSRWYDSNNA